MVRALVPVLRGSQPDSQGTENYMTVDANGEATPSNNAPASESGTGGLPFASLAELALKGISDQPLLFVVVIAVLVIGLGAIGSTMGFSDFRFAVLAAIITLLALIALLGYYVMRAAEMQRAARDGVPSAVIARPPPMAEPVHEKPGTILLPAGDTQPVLASGGPAPEPNNGKWITPAGTITDAQRRHLEHMLAIHDGNLQQLQKRAALYGELDAPVSVQNSIKLEQEAIRRIREQLQTPPT
jgi:hypothetical protein